MLVVVGSLRCFRLWHLPTDSRVLLQVCARVATTRSFSGFWHALTSVKMTNPYTINLIRDEFGTCTTI